MEKKSLSSANLIQVNEKNLLNRCPECFGTGWSVIDCGCFPSRREGCGHSKEEWREVCPKCKWIREELDRQKMGANMEPIYIYRLENENGHGMWYREDGTYDPFIMKLTEGISKHLPMDYDERYGKGGLRWYSGCSEMGKLKHWFSDRDAQELRGAGYKLLRFTSTQYTIEEHQTIFTREGVIGTIEIPYQLVWKI